jgi:hypothetical protein
MKNANVANAATAPMIMVMPSEASSAVAYVIRVMVTE